MKIESEISNAEELDFYLQWTWPEHIERSLRQLMRASLLEAGKPDSRETCQRQYANFRALVAASPESPPAVLRFLADYDDPGLLVSIAENHATSCETLAQLAGSQYVEVRAAVAENRNTSFDVLTTLTNDDSLDVRYSMAENAFLPLIMLEHLAEDENVYIAARAFRTLSRSVSKNPRYQTSLSLRRVHPHPTLSNVLRIQNRRGC